MTVEEFRQKVRGAFGEDLHRASPATVREFLDALQQESALAGHDSFAAAQGDGAFIHEGRFEVRETARSYEEVMRTFFARVLELPEGEAVKMLWAVAFDLSYAVIESHDADRIGHLFRGLEEPTG